MNKSSFFIVGKHAVIEALKNPSRKVLRVFLTEERKKTIHRESPKKNLLKDINILPSRKIKYSLRALPNEISNGISTSIIFSAWNAATYVNQVNDIDILEAEKNKDYDKIVRKIVQQNKGLWFNNELLRIVRK